MSVASRSTTLLASLGRSARGVSVAGDEDSELRSVHNKPRPIGSEPVNTGEYSVIEKTQAKKDVWVIGYYHPVQRTLRLDVLNQRTTPIIVRMEWTGQNDNVQFIEGGVGKVFVPSKNEVTYAQLKVINRALKWSYRYMLYLTEDAEPLDNEIEYEKNKIDLAESVRKFDELRISPKALHEPEFVVRLCEEANVGFIDKDFPPTFSSLYSPEAALELELSNERLIWKRARDFLGPNAQLFEAGIEPADVRQGKLAECWFTCALAALAEHEALIKERFITKSANKAGLYQISLYKSGTPVKVLVDDYFPCFPDGGPAYSRNHGNELWVMLLEKAYAKLHGSYSSIRSGVASEAMQDLTGCPAETFYFYRPSVQEEIKSGEFFSKLDEFHRRGNLLTTRSAEDLDSDETGLVAGHYYTVLDVKTFGSNKLIKLRNPWGDFEWRGKWSDSSAEWTADAKMALHAPKVADDGEFWMSFDDFTKHFRSVCVCYWRPGMQSLRLDGSFRPNSVTGRLQNESFRLVLKDKQSVFVGLHQLDARLPNAPQPYFSVGVMIFDKNAKRVLADSGVKPTRMAQVEVRLDVGEYTLIPYALGKGENVRNPKDLYRPFTLTVHTAGGVGGFSALEPDMTPIDAAFVQSAKKNGKAIACRPGVTLYDWCGKKHFILAVEMTEEWKKGPIKFTCALKQSSNLKLANGTSWSVVLNKAGDAAFLNMGVAHDETQPWVYVYTWTYEGK